MVPFGNPEEVKLTRLDHDSTIIANGTEPVEGAATVMP